MQNMLFGLTYDQIQEMSDEFFKRPTKPEKIGAEKAHQVAMTAAEAAARIQQFSSDTIGKEVAGAYMQAYEAVEGWAKPDAQVNPGKTPGKLTVVVKVGNCIELTNTVNGHPLFITLLRDGTWRYDAGMFGGNIPQKAASAASLQPKDA